MRRMLSAIVDMRKGEGLLTLLLLSYYYLVLVTYYLLKPARDSLFLVKLGANSLPLVFIITALIIAPITTLYATASRKLRLTHLIYMTSGILVVNLFVLRWMLSLDEGWVFYVFYVWVSIYGALTASQFWLFANAVYTPAQGKRLFALINLGGILGAMTGGEITGLLVRTFNVATEDLLFYCIAFISAFTVLAAASWRIYRRDGADPASPKQKAAKKDKSDNIWQTFSLIKRSRHLSYLVGIIALTMATASFVDFQFKTVSSQAYPDKADLTTFLGAFYGRLSLVSLILQMVFAYRFIRIVGVVGIVAFLPLSLMLGSIGMFVMPGLLMAILLRGSDGAFKYSLDKTGRELLFLPIPLEVKNRTKVFIDMFVDRWFRGVAGGALLLCTVVFHMSVRQLSVVVMALLAAWLTLVLLIRKEYVNAFRSALQRRELDPSQLTINISDPRTVETLRESLNSDNAREVEYALAMLAGTRDASLTRDMHRLLSHPSADIRLRAIDILESIGSGSEHEIEKLIADDNADVRLRAVSYLCPNQAGGHDRLRRYLEHEDTRVAATALRWAAESGRVTLIPEGRVASLLSDSSWEVRADVARALGEMSDPAHNDALRSLIDDSNVRLASVAMRAAGRTGDRWFVPLLIQKLTVRRTRRHARAALAEYGNGIVGTLSDHLTDEKVPVSIRAAVPQILQSIGTQDAADRLSEHLTDVDAGLRFRIVKALNKMRQLYPDIGIKTGKVDAAFIEETRAYYEALEVASLHRNRDASAADQLLKRALDERLSRNLERAFRILGLQYPAEDIYNAYLGVVSSSRDRRASAVEFLDNLLGKDLKRYLLPIIDQVTENETISRGQSLFGEKIKTYPEALVRLINGQDPWLRACAVYSGLGSDDPDVKDAVSRARRDPDPLVSEVAALAAG